jgi:hypothetical protein
VKTREEVVEAAIRERIRLHGLRHVHAIIAEEDAQESVPDPAHLAARDRVDHTRQRVLRQTLLKRGEPAHTPAATIRR